MDSGPGRYPVHRNGGGVAQRHYFRYGPRPARLPLDSHQAGALPFRRAELHQLPHRQFRHRRQRAERPAHRPRRSPLHLDRHRARRAGPFRYPVARIPPFLTNARTILRGKALRPRKLPCTHLHRLAQHYCTGSRRIGRAMGGQRRFGHRLSRASTFSIPDTPVSSTTMPATHADCPKTRSGAWPKTREASSTSGTSTKA